ncbi:MFS transporter [Chloroflexota bacterium]
MGFAEDKPKSGRFFYGWWIVAAALGFTFIMAGTGFYSFGVLLKPVMNEFGWSRGAVSVAQSIYLLTAAFAGFVVAKLIERHSIRKIMLLGAIISGITWLLLSLTSSLWYLYIMYFINGLGLGGGAGLIPVAIVTSNWFSKRKGTAMGIVTVGIALGAMIIAPLVGFIAEEFSWRISYLFMGLLVLIVDVPLALFLVKDRPSDMGLVPDGDDPSTVSGIVSDISYDQPVPEVQSSWFKRPAVYWLCLSFVLAQSAEMATLIHEVSFITDMGFSATTAAVALGVTGGVGGIGKVVFGWLTDKISSRYVTALCFGIQLIGLLVLTQTRSMVMIWLFVALFGFGMGGMPTLLPLSVAELFGTVKFGVIYGFVHFIVIGVSSIGPPFAGFIYDTTGSYAFAFNVFVITYFISIIAIYFTWGVNPKPLIRPRMSAIMGHK